MTAKHARYLADEASRAEALLANWPVDPCNVGTAQAVLSYLRISLGIEARMLVAEEIKQFGEPL